MCGIVGYRYTLIYLPDYLQMSYQDLGLWLLSLLEPSQICLAKMWHGLLL